MTKRRGGRAALDRLLEDLASIRATALELRQHPRGLHAIGREAQDILNHPTNLRLVEDAAGKIAQAVPLTLSQVGDTTQTIISLVEELEAFIASDLEKMLERPDATRPARDPEVYRRLEALEARVTALDMERRGVVSLPDQRRTERR
jgi:cobalamin biosynthesis Mg chelatase CobN